MQLFSFHLLLLLLLLFLSASHLLASSSPSNHLSFSFPSFNRSNHDNFNFSDDASVNQGALQVTPDTTNDLNYLLNRSGRIVLSRSFRLWESNRTASFNTSFSINIYRPTNTTPPGEGLAFIIAPDANGPPPGSHGGFLGLTNSSTDGLSSNRIVAVEFDTVKQGYDLDDNHVGLDINGVNSKNSVSLTPLGIQIAPVGAVNYTVWIDYDGVGGVIGVFMSRQGKAKPETAVLVGKVNLSDYVNQDSYFGFAAATGGKDYELNCVLDWNLTVENLEEEKNDEKGGSGWKVAAGIVAGVFVISVVAGTATALWYSKKRRETKNKVKVDPSVLAGTLKSLPGMPREFEYKDLRKATNDFDEKMKLGQGGFGIVYKGVIAGEGTEVAVKKFSREDNMNSQDDFLKELTVINRLRHKHLVRLLGWCHEDGVLLLVYDYMPNGSLDQHLYATATSHHFLLPWHRRIQVAADVASALHYLHHEYDECVLHRDLKSSNVMLDSSFHARLGDFGLARVLDTDKTSYIELEAAGVPGTIGYIAPECFHTAKATRESDLFAFGALLLELVCGRRPRCINDLSEFHFLVDWVWMLHREGRIVEAVDEKLEGNFVADEVRRMLLLGLACSHPSPSERPKSAVIMQVLAGSVPPPVVPAFRPAFMWPAAEPAGSGGFSSMSSLLTSSSMYPSSTTCEIYD